MLFDLQGKTNNFLKTLQLKGIRSYPHKHRSMDLPI